MKTLATEVKKGDLVKSPFFSKTTIRVEEIKETEKQLTFIGPYVENQSKEFIGKTWAYTFRKTTRVNLK